MRIGFFSTFTPEYSVAEACAMARELGYEGIQPRVAPGMPYDPAQPLNPWCNNRCTIPEDTFLKNPNEALKPAREAGLEVISIPSYCGVGEMERAARLIRACGEAGVSGMRLGPLPLAPDAPLVDVNSLVAESRQRYRALLAVSKPAGVKLVMELHMGSLIPNPAAAWRILDGFDPRELGVIYDPGNMVYEGHEPARLSVGTLGPYLAEVHVKNSRWIYDGSRPAGQRWHCVGADLADGVADWPNVIATLASAGFNGWLIEEGERHTEGILARDRLRTNIGYLRSWLAQAAMKPAV
jgi:sugar phosphate isomerase/epimerase